jgi:hypothetical protein
LTSCCSTRRTSRRSWGLLQVEGGRLGLRTEEVGRVTVEDGFGVGTAAAADLPVGPQILMNEGAEVCNPRGVNATAVQVPAAVAFDFDPTVSRGSCYPRRASPTPGTPLERAIEAPHK